MNDVETRLRETLTSAEAAAPAPADLSERLIARTLEPARVVPLRPRRAVRRWLPPLLAAAVIVTVVTVGAIVRHTVAAPDRPVHPRPVPPKIQFPTQFSATDVYFRDAQHGWALGDGCADPGRGCVTLLRTIDGGASWRVVPPPPVTVPVNECTHEGDGVAGAGDQPCVDAVAFADDRHGYAWGYRTFFWTNDGGRSWRLERGRPQRLVIAGGTVVRTEAKGAATGRTVVQVQRVGATGWQTVTPAVAGMAETSQLLPSGRTVYFLASQYPRGGTLFRSTDGGRTWTKVNPAPCGSKVSTTYLSLAPDGTLAAVCYGGADATIRISTDHGHVFGPDMVAPGTHKTAQAQLIPNVLAVSPSVLLERVADRHPSVGNDYRRTTDGGRTWHRIGIDDAMAVPFLWQMFDARNGVRMNEPGVSGRDGTGLLFTHDWGKTWTPRPFAP